MHITIHRTQLSGYSILNYQKMLKIVDFMKFSFWLFSLSPPLKAPLSQLEKLEPKQAIQIVSMSHFQRDNTPGRKKNSRKERKF